MIDTMKRVFYLTTEAVPFAKTGGLADVCGALPIAVQNDPDSDYRSAIVMPAFASIYQSGLPIEPTDVSFAIDLNHGKLIGGRLLRTNLPNPQGAPVPVWLIDQPRYFGRDGLYGPPGGAYEDNAERFIFFCRAAIAVLRRMVGGVDVIHCNDWQTGLIPALIAADPVARRSFADTATVMTIHNLAYQGNFDRDVFAMMGLDWSEYRSESFEYYGGNNFLKTGIVSTDAITTVSSRYADEICTPAMGCGLDSILSARRSDLTGIVNGIDPGIWNPSTDSHLAKTFDASDWQIGKAANKAAVQQELSITVDPELPVIGLVGRLASQKGWDLIVPMIEQSLSQSRPVQWAILGSGDVDYEKSLRRLRDQYPSHFGLQIGFDERLAHRIEAASDLFLMPSQYEPCGLNQLYSLCYGAVPIVTPVGGLADTVVDATPSNRRDRTATGFWIVEPSVAGMDAAVSRALELKFQHADEFNAMVVRGMRQDWSWRQSGKKYVELYDRLVSQPLASAQ